MRYLSLLTAVLLVFASGLASAEDLSGNNLPSDQSIKTVDEIGLWKLTCKDETDCLLMQGIVVEGENGKSSIILALKIIDGIPLFLIQTPLLEKDTLFLYVDTKEFSTLPVDLKTSCATTPINICQKLFRVTDEMLSQLMHSKTLEVVASVQTNKAVLAQFNLDRLSDAILALIEKAPKTQP